MANYVWWFTVAFIGCLLMQKPVISNPQTHLLNEGCSQYNVTNLPDFFKRLNASVDDLRNQLSKHNKRFAITQQSVYAMVGCRKYMSRADCVSCFDAAAFHIRSCASANGAPVIYDGCFLRGYTAPEYAIHGHLTEKVDVYSFGVVVLEIISGRRSNDMQIETEYLLEQAWKLHETGIPVKLVDETLDPNEYNEQEVKKIIEIALICTQSPPNLRPSMSEVVVMLLSDHSTHRRTPSRPAFVSMDKITMVDSSMTTGSSASNATNTFTDITGR